MSRNRIWRYISIEIRNTEYWFGVVEFDNIGQNLLGERKIYGPQFSDIQQQHHHQMLYLHDQKGIKVLQKLLKFKY